MALWVRTCHRSLRVLGLRSRAFLGHWLLRMASKPAEKISVILMVEDSDVVRKCFVMMLTQPHRQILEATSCKAALILAAATPRIDMLIVDLTLPDGFGTAILCDLKARFPDIGVIITSGTPISHWPEPARLEAARWPDGSWQWLAKPFKSSFLVEMVQVFLDEAPKTIRAKILSPPAP